MGGTAGERLRVGRVARSAKRRLRKRFYLDGTPENQWCRVVMNRRITEHLDGLGCDKLDAIEVSGSLHKRRPWKAYTSTDWTTLDVCDPPDRLDPHDVVLCEQVLEHVPDPWRAAQTLYDLCRPGGQVVVSTPFLIPVHGPPDYWRFTQTGIRLVLERAGLVVDETGSWGSKRAARGNLRRVPPWKPWRSLRDEFHYPLVIWALAHRPAEV
ncbi:MAG TPA: methyltransferase domain-containing protein [Acidimicrobiia bacterium]